MGFFSSDCNDLKFTVGCRGAPLTVGESKYETLSGTPYFFATVMASTFVFHTLSTRFMRWSLERFINEHHRYLCLILDKKAYLHDRFPALLSKFFILLYTFSFLWKFSYLLLHHFLFLLSGFGTKDVRLPINLVWDQSSAYSIDIISGVLVAMYLFEIINSRQGKKKLMQNIFTVTNIFLVQFLRHHETLVLTQMLPIIVPIILPGICIADAFSDLVHIFYHLFPLSSPWGPKIIFTFAWASFILHMVGLTMIGVFVGGYWADIYTSMGFYGKLLLAFACHWWFLGAWLNDCFLRKLAIDLYRLHYYFTEKTRRDFVTEQQRLCRPNKVELQIKEANKIICSLPRSARFPSIPIADQYSIHRAEIEWCDDLEIYPPVTPPWGSLLAPRVEVRKDGVKVVRNDPVKKEKNAMIDSYESLRIDAEKKKARNREREELFREAREKKREEMGMSGKKMETEGETVWVNPIQEDPMIKPAPTKRVTRSQTRARTESIGEGIEENGVTEGRMIRRSKKRTG